MLHDAQRVIVYSLCPMGFVATLLSIIFTVPRLSLLFCVEIFVFPKAVSRPQCDIVQSDNLNSAADKVRTFEEKQ